MRLLVVVMPSTASGGTSDRSIMTSLCADEYSSALLPGSIPHLWRCSGFSMNHTSFAGNFVVSIAMTLDRRCGAVDVMYLMSVYGSCVQCMYGEARCCDPYSMASLIVIVAWGVCLGGRTCHGSCSLYGVLKLFSVGLATLYTILLSAAAIIAMYARVLLCCG